MVAASVTQIIVRRAVSSFLKESQKYTIMEDQRMSKESKECAFTYQLGSSIKKLKYFK